jgi:hypothetical protein
MKNLSIFIKLILHIRLKWGYKHTFRRLTTSGNFSEGSFVCGYDSFVEDKAVGFYVKIYTKIFTYNIIGTLLHEVGHVRFQEMHLKRNKQFYKDNILKEEMVASKYAIRVMDKLGIESQARRVDLEHAYNTYLRHYIKCPLQLADESAKVIKQFGIKY